MELSGNLVIVTTQSYVSRMGRTVVVLFLMLENSGEIKLSLQQLLGQSAMAVNPGSHEAESLRTGLANKMLYS